MSEARSVPAHERWPRKARDGMLDEPLLMWRDRLARNERRRVAHELAELIADAIIDKEQAERSAHDWTRWGMFVEHLRMLWTSASGLSWDFEE